MRSFTDALYRDELVPIFHDFYQLARTVGADVQRFHSHLGRTYDTAIHLSAQTERKLSEIQALESGSETARVSSLLHPSSLLAFFMPASRSSRDIVRTEYLAHLTRLKGSIDTLILENELVVANLDTLEEYLYRIHDLAVTDDHHVHAQHYQLAPGGIGGSLAALFRGRGQALALNRVRDSLDVLDQLRTNRDVASKLVSGSLLQLRGVSRELEDLRVRVVQREVVSEDEAVSLEFQITMIRSSLLRMEMGKQRTRKAKEDFYGGLQRQIDQNFDQRT